MPSPVTSLAGPADEGLGHGRGLGPHRLLGVGRPRRVVRADPGQLDALEHARPPCAWWPGRWRSAGRTAPGPWRTRRPGRSWPASCPAARRTGRPRRRRRRGARSRCGRRRGRPARPASSSSSSRATRRVTSSVGDQLGRRALDDERADALLGAGRRPAPSRRCAPSSTTGLVPVSRHAPDLRLARVRIRSTTSPWPSSSSATVPRVTPGGERRQPVVEPEAAGGQGREHRRGEERAREAAAGPSPRARPSSRAAPCPAPPCSSGTSRPTQPRSTSCCHTRR